MANTFHEPKVINNNNLSIVRQGVCGIISACLPDLGQGGQFGGKVFAKLFATFSAGGKHLRRT
jgi:hypothetical protein